MGDSKSTLPLPFPFPLTEKVKELSPWHALQNPGLGVGFTEDEKRQWWKSKDYKYKLGTVRSVDLDKMITIYTETFDMSKRQRKISKTSDSIPTKPYTLTDKNIEQLRDNTGINVSDFDEELIEKSLDTMKNATDFEDLYLGWLSKAEQAEQAEQAAQAAEDKNSVIIKETMKTLFRFVFGKKTINDKNKAERFYAHLRFAYTNFESEEKVPCKGTIADNFKSCLEYRLEGVKKEISAARQSGFPEYGIYGRKLYVLEKGLIRMINFLDSKSGCFEYGEYSGDAKRGEKDSDEEAFLRALMVAKEIVDADASASDAEEHSLRKTFDKPVSGVAAEILKQINDTLSKRQHGDFDMKAKDDEIERLKAEIEKLKVDPDAKAALDAAKAEAEAAKAAEAAARAEADAAKAAEAAARMSADSAAKDAAAKATKDTIAALLAAENRAADAEARLAAALARAGDAQALAERLTSADAALASAKAALAAAQAEKANNTAQLKKTILVLMFSLIRSRRAFELLSAQMDESGEVELERIMRDVNEKIASLPEEARPLVRGIFDFLTEKPVEGQPIEVLKDLIRRKGDADKIIEYANRLENPLRLAAVTSVEQGIQSINALIEDIRKKQEDKVAELNGKVRGLRESLVLKDDPAVKEELSRVKAALTRAQAELDDCNKIRAEQEVSIAVLEGKIDALALPPAKRADIDDRLAAFAAALTAAIDAEKFDKIKEEFAATTADAASASVKEAEASVKEAEAAEAAALAAAEASKEKADADAAMAATARAEAASAAASAAEEKDTALSDAKGRAEAAEEKAAALAIEKVGANARAAAAEEKAADSARDAASAKAAAEKAIDAATAAAGIAAKVSEEAARSAEASAATAIAEKNEALAALEAVKAGSAQEKTAAEASLKDATARAEAAEAAEAAAKAAEAATKEAADAKLAAVIAAAMADKDAAAASLRAAKEALAQKDAVEDLNALKRASDAEKALAAANARVLEVENLYAAANAIHGPALERHAAILKENEELLEIVIKFIQTMNKDFTEKDNDRIREELSRFAEMNTNAEKRVEAALAIIDAIVPHITDKANPVRRIEEVLRNVPAVAEAVAEAVVEPVEEEPPSVEESNAEMIKEIKATNVSPETQVKIFKFILQQLQLFASAGALVDYVPIVEDNNKKYSHFIDNYYRNNKIKNPKFKGQGARGISVPEYLVSDGKTFWNYIENISEKDKAIDILLKRINDIIREYSRDDTIVERDSNFPTNFTEEMSKRLLFLIKTSFESVGITNLNKQNEVKGIIKDKIKPIIFSIAQEVQSGGGHIGSKGSKASHLCDLMLTSILLKLDGPEFNYQALIDKAGKTLDDIGQCDLILEMLNHLIDEHCLVKKTKGYTFSSVYMDIPQARALVEAFNKNFTDSEKQKFYNISGGVFNYKVPEEQTLLGKHPFFLVGTPQGEETPLYGVIDEEITLTMEERSVLEEGSIPIGAILFLYIVCFRETEGHDPWGLRSSSK